MKITIVTISENHPDDRLAIHYKLDDGSSNVVIIFANDYVETSRGRANYVCGLATKAIQKVVFESLKSKIGVEL